MMPAVPWSMRLYARLLRLIPIAGGLTRLAFNTWTNQGFSRVSGTTYARMLNGMSISVDPRDYHGRILYLFGTNDPKVHHVAQALLDIGDRFLDIGANYGSIGLLASDRVGSNGQVHLFEPQPHLCQAIRQVLASSKRSNVYLHEVALMDRDDVMWLARPTGHSGMATLVKHCDQTAWDKLTVDVRDIAAYVQPLIDAKPFGAKIDVEGAEIYLIPWLLKQPLLKFVIFEAAHNVDQLWALVRASGLQLYGLKRTLFAKQLTRIDDVEHMQRYHDVVAVRVNGLPRLPSTIASYALGRIMRRAWSTY